MKNPHRWTEQEIAFLREKYKEFSVGELLGALNEHFGLSIKKTQLQGCLRNYKIKSGRTGRFEKGHIPANKGTKGLSVGGVETQFKKGNKPSNYRPVGSERIDVDGYIVVKVSDKGEWSDRWKVKQRVVWEAAYGPIPKGHVIVFLDGNKQNVRLSNLQMITKSALARMNQNDLFSDNPEVTKVGITIAKVQAAIGKTIAKTKEQTK